jgi:hypothetical protein
MNQLEFIYYYPEYLQLETNNFSCFLSSPIIIENILDKNIELIDQ